MNIPILILLAWAVGILPAFLIWSRIETHDFLEHQNGKCSCYASPHKPCNNYYAGTAKYNWDFVVFASIMWPLAMVLAILSSLYELIHVAAFAKILSFFWRRAWFGIKWLCRRVVYGKHHNNPYLSKS